MILKLTAVYFLIVIPFNSYGQRESRESKQIFFFIVKLKIIRRKTSILKLLFRCSLTSIFQNLKIKLIQIGICILCLPL